MNTTQQGRLDFFLISRNVCQFVQNCDIDISYRSDHSIVILQLSLASVKHGKGLWKFNNSLLNDIQYVNTINKIIEDVTIQYCLPVYNIENISLLDRSSMQFTINDQLFLETLLMEVRGKTISFSCYKNKERKNKEEDIQSEIIYIENNLNEDNKERLQALQRKLEEIRNIKLKGIVTRSRLQWVEQGEKLTKYFCNLEKKSISNKHIPFIEKDDQSKIFDQKEILKETFKFYKDLYNKKQPLPNIDLEKELKGIYVNKLDINQSYSLEGSLSYDEVSSTLKNMKNDKSHGGDGFTVNFFKMFWGKIGFFCS